MRLESLNWFDVEKYLKQDDRLILLFGSCEQHGYLSLLTDVNIPQALADTAAKQEGVLIAPPINYGSSPYFLNYPGTISLRMSTLVDVAEDVIRSVYAGGFRKILVINGHGGNKPVFSRLCELANQFEDCLFRWYTWYESHTVEEILIKHDLKSFHAGWIEAFQFNIVTELPAGKKKPPHVPGILSARETRKLYGDGVFGGLYHTDKAILDQIFQAALDDVINLLQFN